MSGSGSLKHKTIDNQFPAKQGSFQFDARLICRCSCIDFILYKELDVTISGWVVVIHILCSRFSQSHGRTGYIPGTTSIKGGSPVFKEDSCCPTFLVNILPGFC